MTMIHDIPKSLAAAAVDCSHEEEDLPSFLGGWIGIVYPDAKLGKKSAQVIVGIWPDGPGINGNIVDWTTALLSKADTTTEKTVSGSLDFRASAFDPGSAFGKANIKGSFEVPYCPEI